jgi:hypothetical protein
MYCGMSSALRRLLHRLPIQSGGSSGRRLKTTCPNLVQIVSFLETGGFRVRRLDQDGRSRRRRRVARGLLMWVTAFFTAWITLESTRAVSFF